MQLEPFQQATVEAAVRALTNRQGSRRFLIADEVGLGKTIVARTVARRLAERAGGAFNVVYFCPSLEIAAQNIGKFTQKEAPNSASNAQVSADRLSLACVEASRGSRSAGFRVFSYTPDTSLPGWRGGQRTGRAAERAVIAALTHAVAPRFWRRLRAIERQGQRARARERSGGAGRWLWPDKLPAVDAGLVRLFEPALRTVMGLTHRTLEPALRKWLDDRERDVAEFILRARSALALAALQSDRTRPHLLVLDEFHRYADLLLPLPDTPGAKYARERMEVSRRLVSALLGSPREGPAILLLSATPYRLRRADDRDLPGQRYQQFANLAAFLHGAAGSDTAAKVRRTIDLHQRALQRRDDKAAALKAAFDAKATLEALLHPVMARTERALGITHDLFKPAPQKATITTDDLAVFRDFAHRVDADRSSGFRHWVLPLWASVPYPAETLFDYQVARAFKGGAVTGLRTVPPVTSQTFPRQAAHPQLRALYPAANAGESVLASDLLGLPWLPPSRPWWRLGGRWADLAQEPVPPGKTLLFSRYRATPLAISALLSRAVDHRESRQQKGKSKFSAQAFLRLEPRTAGRLVALFMPWPRLSQAQVPVAPPDCPPQRAKALMRRGFRAWLEKQKDVTVGAAPAGRRQAWQLAVAVECALGGDEDLKSAMRQLPSDYRHLLPVTDARPVTLTPGECDRLADYLLGVPGAVVGRSLHRHQPAIWADRKLFIRAFRFCWQDLRAYLGQRYFAGPIMGRRRKGPGFPTALCTAIVDGGLEAVLDEHLAIMAVVGEGAALEALETALPGRPGLVRLRRRNGTTERVRVHAALPFAGAERRGGDGRRDKLRSDTVRKAFNSPFWPHVLATTTVGQEGLDFHVWCNRIVHWDLPRDPVDFEQREGRIVRYGSLGVRQALAGDHGAGLPASAEESPFRQLLKQAAGGPAQADDRYRGLERWWAPRDHAPLRVTFEVPFSRGSQRLADLQQDLLRYRLALGQPDPTLFEKFVDHFGLSPAEQRTLALNLSPRAPG